MSMALETRGFIFNSLWHLSTKCHRYYYKMRQLFYCKMRQKFITNALDFLLQNVMILLRNVTVITKFDVYYKSRQYNYFSKYNLCECRLTTCVYHPLWFRFGEGLISPDQLNLFGISVRKRSNPIIVIFFHLTEWITSLRNKILVFSSIFQ